MNSSIHPDVGAAARSEDRLPRGARVGEFLIEDLIGQGRESVVYRARDRARGCDVALKEYLPAQLARRNARGLLVCAAGDAATFDAGRRRFMREAMEMARIEHASLVRVQRAWEHAGSAYVLMPLVQGRLLADAFGPDAQAPAQTAIAVRPLLDLLDVLHQRHCTGLDLSAHRLRVLADGRPMLMRLGPRSPALPGALAQSRAAEPAWRDLQALARTLLGLMAGSTCDGGFLQAMRAAASDDAPQRPADARALMAALQLPERRARSRLIRDQQGARWSAHAAALRDPASPLAALRGGPSAGLMHQRS